MTNEELANMRIKDRPNKVRAKLIIDVEGEFYDDESVAETLRYCVEQDLEDAGFNVIDSEVFDLDKHDEEIIKNTVESIWGEPCEDCISREAVRKLLANQRDKLVKLHTVNPKDNPKADAMAYGVNWSLNTLMELPSVTPSYNSIKSELKQPSEDCISREQALKVIETEKQGWEGTERYAIDECHTRIAELPPVTPQPEIGHWITTRTFMHDGEYYCDRCKCDSPNNEKWDYCPNCGAKMEGIRGGNMNDR